MRRALRAAAASRSSLGCSLSLGEAIATCAAESALAWGHVGTCHRASVTLRGE